jgi:two-component system chemotaxis response regulator CheY
MAKKLFLVDDSATMLMSLRNGLELAGFDVDTAGDGLEALNKLKGGLKPDLMITDINMPNMDGIQLIQGTRNLSQFRFMPIVVLSTETQQGKREEAKKLGATGWMVKPVTGADLLKVVKQMLPGS